jgi:hypothetical protein
MLFTGSFSAEKVERERFSDRCLFLGIGVVSVFKTPEHH